MHPFTSLIYIKPNSSTDEKIAVAMVASGTDKMHFAYSVNKIKKALALANHSIEKPIERYFKNIAESITEANSKGLHFAENYIFNENHLVYLNRYDNGIFYFEKPNTLSIALTEKQFAELYKMMLNEDIEAIEKSKPHAESLKTTIKNKLKERPLLRAKADIEYTVKPEIVTGIFSEIDLDYITVNGAINAGMHIDFNTSTDTIAKHIYEYFCLANALNRVELKRKRTSSPIYNIYFNSPESKDQKILLDKMRKDKTIEGVEAKELEVIEKDVEAIENNDKYVPFSSLLLAAI